MKVVKYIVLALILIAILSLFIMQIILFINMGKMQESITGIKNDIDTLMTSPTPELSITPSPTAEVTPTATITNNPTQTMTVKLYYKNFKLDPEVLDCSADGFVERTIPKTTTPLTDAIKLLLINDLTSGEKALGFESEFNTNVASKKVTLISASVTSGTATLNISDPDDFTSGGSCRSGILASQFTKTAKQFSTVTNVELPSGLFQP